MRQFLKRLYAQFLSDFAYHLATAQEKRQREADYQTSYEARQIRELAKIAARKARAVKALNDPDAAKRVLREAANRVEAEKTFPVAWNFPRMSPATDDRELKEFYIEQQMLKGKHQ